jgi:hypothetical protein
VADDDRRASPFRIQMAADPRSRSAIAVSIACGYAEYPDLHGQRPDRNRADVRAERRIWSVKPGVVKDGSGVGGGDWAGDGAGH